MTASITVLHNFETAHRLPFLPGKCQSLHGHSWWAEVSMFGPVDADGVLIDFGAVKARLRSWIDTHLDHGVMLGVADPLADVLPDHGCKVFVFDPVAAGSPCGLWSGGRELAWPTVENVAELLRRVAASELVAVVGTVPVDRYSIHVRVRETHVNEATAR